MLRRWTKPGLRVHVGATQLVITPAAALATTVRLPLPAATPGAAAAAFDAWWAGESRIAARERLSLTFGVLQAPVLLLPWTPELVRPAFAKALAGALLEKQLQQPATAYVIALGPVRYGRPRLAAALPQQELEAWRAVAQRCGLRLVSAQPRVLAVWNAQARRLVRETVQLLVVEDGRLLLLQHQGGIVQRIALRPLDGPGLLACVGERRTALVAPAAVVAQLPAEVRGRLIVLPDREDASALEPALENLWEGEAS